MKSRSNISQVVDIALGESRFIEAEVVKVFPQTRTAYVRMDGASQYTYIDLGIIDPAMLYITGARVLLYKSGGKLYPISVIPGRHAPSSAGVALGDRWGSTSFDIYSSQTYGSQSYKVAGIDSLGNIYYYGDLIPVRNEVKYISSGFIPLTTQLTHSSFNGDSFSDVGSNTKIENTSWSSTIPSDATALLIHARARDSASLTTNWLYFELFSSASETVGDLIVRLDGCANDVFGDTTNIMRCTDGDIWYRCNASGTDTMDVYLWCLGYWI